MIGHRRIGKTAARWCAALGAAALLAGCGGGGGGGGGTTPPPPASAVLSGTVAVPAGRDVGTLTPVPGATVRLYQPGTDTPAGNAVTAGTDGVFRFTSVPTPGTLYEIRATGTVGGVARNLRALVRAASTANPSTPVQMNVNPSTTVALRSALLRADELMDTGQFVGGNPFDLATLYADFRDAFNERVEDGDLTMPDGSSLDDADDRYRALVDALAPTGAFVGTYHDAQGAEVGKFALLARNDAYLLVHLDPAFFDTTPNGTEDEPVSDFPVAYGFLEETDATAAATTEDGWFDWSLAFHFGLAQGTWHHLESDERGTWRAARPDTATYRWDGVYGGSFADDASGPGAGQFAIVVIQHNVWIFGFDSFSGFGVFGRGTVTAQGQISYRWEDLTGRTGNSTGTIGTDGIARGTLRVTGDESYGWESRSTYDPSVF